MAFTSLAARKHIAIASISTAFLDAGQGETMVALHGIPTSSALFEPLLPFLNGYRLLAPDLLGQGETGSLPTGPLGHAAYQAHLSGFLDLVPPPTFHLIVHDLGGVLGLEWAADHAERVKGVVILSTTIAWSFRLGLIYAANLLLGEALLRRSLAATLKRQSSLEPSLLECWARPWSRRRLLRGVDHFAPAHLRRLRAKLKGLRLPVLMIWGEQDDIFPPARVASIARELPQAKLIMIPRCGHWSPLDAPEEVARHTVDFLKSGAATDALPRTA